MTAIETTKLLAVMLGAWPWATVDDEAIAVWTAALGDIDYGLADQALRRAILTDDRPPSIAAIRRAVAGLRGQLPAPAEDAWREVCSNVDRWARRQPSVWTNQVAERIAKTIGLRFIAESERPGVERGQFLRLYAEASAAAVISAGAPVLAAPVEPPRAFPDRGEARAFMAELHARQAGADAAD